MSIKVTQQEAVTVLTLTGRFDALMSREFKSCLSGLINNKRLYMVIDMSSVDFIDSSGMGALVGGVRGVIKEQGEIRIAGLSPEVQTIFELTRLHRIFDIYETVDRACASFS